MESALKTRSVPFSTKTHHLKRYHVRMRASFPSPNGYFIIRLCIFFIFIFWVQISLPPPPSEAGFPAKSSGFPIGKWFPGRWFSSKEGELGFWRSSIPLHSQIGFLEKRCLLFHPSSPYLENEEPQEIGGGVADEPPHACKRSRDRRRRLGRRHAVVPRATPLFASWGFAVREGEACPGAMRRTLFLFSTLFFLFNLVLIIAGSIDCSLLISIW